ncbi:MAG: selenide, water dikinase SelD [Pseudohongiellaceae bacterium]|nr:selenide, water dikinase SelD [Pseudohongiellaceae bacterium]
MQGTDTTPKSKHLVLLGGGHSHLSVLMEFAKNPLPGLAITLISKDIVTPYSGAMPAFIRGDIDFDSMHIDLRPLAKMAGARIISAKVNQIDTEAKLIKCDHRPDIEFDILSINIGSTPSAELIEGARENALAVKPIRHFLGHWQKLIDEIPKEDNSQRNIAVVGGGAASVELALAMQTRLSESLNSNSPTITLLCKGPHLLAQHNSKAQKLALSALERRGVKVLLKRKVIRVTPNSIEYTNTDSHEGSKSLAVDYTILTTGASAPKWLQSTGLTLDSHGFILVNQSLQSLSHPDIFAAGDIASIEHFARPKSGVYAVRQGAPLAINLRRHAAGLSLKRHVPQKQALALLSIDAKTAIAVRGSFVLQGNLAARLKNWIDQGFVAKYSNIKPPKEAAQLQIKHSTRPGLGNSAPHIRCSGCASKIAQQLLQETLSSTAMLRHTDILSDTQQAEDCSIIQLDDHRLLLQSVDQLRTFIDDPYQFARIATLHCLSDIHAMGATPHSAHALVNLPFGAPAIMQAMLKEVMAGCSEVLAEHDTALIGGHTGEAAELSLGLSVNSFAKPEKVLRKTTARAGDVLVLCKALGTGTLLAADMRFQAKYQWIEEALASMLLSNQRAARIFLEHRANACTDITGFGVIGHLSEMLTGNNLSASLKLDAVPVLAGALESLEAGYFSSIHDENMKPALNLGLSLEQLRSPNAAILCDPQTSGGLLAAIPPQYAQECIASLKREGYSCASLIGELTASAAARITLG